MNEVNQIIRQPIAPDIEQIVIGCGEISQSEKDEKAVRKRGFESAIAVGKKLNQTKEEGKASGRIPHGTWKDWRLHNIIEPFDISPGLLDHCVELANNETVLRAEIEKRQKSEGCDFCFSKTSAIKFLRNKAKKEREGKVSQAAIDKEEARRNEAAQRRKSLEDLADKRIARNQSSIGIPLPSSKEREGMGDEELRRISGCVNQEIARKSLWGVKEGDENIVEVDAAHFLAALNLVKDLDPPAYQKQRHLHAVEAA